MCEYDFKERYACLVRQTDTHTHTHMNMNAGVALVQAEFWPSWVSSWGQANPSGIISELFKLGVLGWDLAQGLLMLCNNMKSEPIPV